MAEIGEMILSRQKEQMSLLLKQFTLHRRRLGVLAHAGVPKMDVFLICISYIHLGFKEVTTPQFPVVVRVGLRV